METRARSWARLASFAVFAIVACGCYVEARPAPPLYGYSMVYADDVPYGIETYPHVWYHGQWVYLVGGRWYCATTSGWVVFVDEPYELHHHREVYWGPHPGPRPHDEWHPTHAPPVQYAPPANVAPPAYPKPAKPNVAPPVYKPKPFQPKPIAPDGKK